MNHRPNTGHCRSCGAPIEWAYTAKDELMPVDAEPNREGNIVTYREGDTDIIRAKVLGPLELEELYEVEAEYGGQEELYTSHFATCPDAAKWRKR